jgi:hypothetical protein
MKPTYRPSRATQLQLANNFHHRKAELAEHTIIANWNLKKTAQRPFTFSQVLVDLSGYSGHTAWGEVFPS